MNIPLAEMRRLKGLAIVVLAASFFSSEIKSQGLDELENASTESGILSVTTVKSEVPSVISPVLNDENPILTTVEPNAFIAEEVLDTYVISSTRSSEMNSFSVPYTVNVISESTLEERQVRNLTEALERVPGVMVQKTSNGQGSPYIRGFTGYRTLAVIDGVRYNNSVYRDGPSEYFSLIDSNAISSIELLQGPGSVLYGSDAIGGTIYLQTKSADFLSEAEGEHFLHGSTTYRYHTAEQSHQERLEFQTGVGGKWGLQLGATLKDFGNVRAADIGEQLRTGYEEYAYDARLDVLLNDNWTLTAAHQKLSQDDVWRTHSTIFGVSFAGSEIGSDRLRLKDQHRMLNYVKLRGENLEGIVDTATITASLQRWEENGARIRGNGRSLVESFDSKMYGLDVQLESDTGIGYLSYGIDYYVDNVDTARTDFSTSGVATRAVQGPVGDDAQFGQLGVFIQDTISLNDRTELTFGGRLSHVHTDVGQYEDPASGEAASFSDDWQSVVGSARLTYDLDAEERYKVFGGISQSFRAPNLADLTRAGGSRSDEVESAAVGLEPEKFLTYEIGLKAQTGLLTSSLSVYRTEISDLISSTPTGRTVDGLREVTKQNSAEGYTQGVEFNASYQLEYGFEIFGTVAYVEGEADLFPFSGSPVAAREPLSRIQPLISTGGIRWTAPNDNFWVEASVLAASKADRLNRNDAGDTQRIPPGGTPAYTILDVHAGWDIKENMTLYGGLENLLDESYRVHGSGSNEPGFGGVMGLKVEF